MGPDPRRVEAVDSGWSGRRVLITGAGGFIGQHLARRLEQAGAQVWKGLCPGGRKARRSDAPGHAKRLTLDVTDGNSVGHVMLLVEPHVVFHLAAIGVTNPTVGALDALAVNTGGLIRLLETLRDAEVQRVVLIGSSHEYGAREARRAWTRSISMRPPRSLRGHLRGPTGGPFLSLW